MIINNILVFPGLSVAVRRSIREVVQFSDDTVLLSGRR